GADTEHGFTTVTARFVVDAKGRTHRRTRPRDSGTASTAALSSQWIAAEAPVAAEMLVEALADNWLWAARLPDGRVCAAVFVDLDSCRGLNRDERESRFAELIHRSSLLRPMAPARIENVDVCDASACINEVVATRHMIKVGDAASAFDPI